MPKKPARKNGTKTPKPRAAVEIPRSLVEYLLLGPADDRRQLQDSPILGDVWIAFAQNANAPQDLLITPYQSEPAGRVAKTISDRMVRFGRKRDGTDYANIAYLQGLIAARLYLEEVARVVLPITNWWQDKKKGKAGAGGAAEIKTVIDRILKRATGADHDASSDPVVRYLLVTGLLLWAQDADPAKVEKLSEKAPAAALSELDHKAIASRISGLFQDLIDESDDRSLVWQVSLNRKAVPALDKSVAAVKADAATTLFSVKCDEIAWAVLDSGIDGEHPAFLDANGNSRIKQAFDFRYIREIISLDNLDENARKARLTKMRERLQGNRGKVDRRQEKKDLEDLETLANDAADGRPIHWELVERFVKVDPKSRPYSSHGTHVAGILGARAVDGNAGGICPDIRLYDFRILSKSVEDTEFAVIAALQYIRHLNGRSSFVAIHGVNLSLSIPHDVRNFACGRTPVCNECERLIDNGLVVVAAAGNRGYQSIQTKEGSYEGYMAFSVTDPGNADGVITVGATHRYWPHTYGVSFFSSRGPTGDGRLKPDLVAPGERIRAPLPEKSWGELDGTSMAAPHVSGAAAMLMARYSELIGRPRRIKQILCDSATDLGRDRSFQGSGMLDVLRAFQSI